MMFLLRLFLLFVVLLTLCKKPSNVIASQCPHRWCIYSFKISKSLFPELLRERERESQQMLCQSHKKVIITRLLAKNLQINIQSSGAESLYTHSLGACFRRKVQECFTPGSVMLLQYWFPAVKIPTRAALLMSLFKAPMIPPPTSLYGKANKTNFASIQVTCFDET